MDKQTFLTEVGKTAFALEQQYGGCAQCTLGAIQTHLGHVSPDTFTAATALAGGVAASGNACGACTGAILAIGSFLGRDLENFGTPEGLKAKDDATMLGQKIIHKFEEEYGFVQCAKIQEKLYGKSFHMAVPEEKKQFLACGGHGDHGCAQVVANAARWTAEVLLDAGLAQLPEE